MGDPAAASLDAGAGAGGADFRQAEPARPSERGIKNEAQWQRPRRIRETEDALPASASEQPGAFKSSFRMGTLLVLSLEPEDLQDAIEIFRSVVLDFEAAPFFAMMDGDMGGEVALQLALNPEERGC